MRKPVSHTVIGPAPTWISVLAGIFGGITLVGLFVFAFMAGLRPDFVCNSFTLLAAVFALGAALSAGFIGGAASLTGNLGTTAKRNALVFSAGGGIAVLFIAFWIFQHFQPDACPAKTIGELKQIISTLRSDISNKTTEIDRLMKQDIRIFPTSTASSLPLRQILIQYTSRNGESRDAKKEGETFLVPLTDLFKSGEIFVVYNPEAIPAERQGRSPRITIDHFTYSIDPLLLRLFLAQSSE